MTSRDKCLVDLGNLISLCACLNTVNIDIVMCTSVTVFRASLVAQLVKNLPVMRETQVQSLGWEDPLENEIATHSSILAWKISWMEEPGGLQSTGLQRVRHDFTSIPFW